MSDDNSTDDGPVSVNYRISSQARKDLGDYAKIHSLSMKDALSHILECVGRDNDIIPRPTQYTVKLDLGTNGDTVSIATCSVCQEPFSPSVHGTSIESLLAWVNDHNDKHAKKG